VAEIQDGLPVCCVEPLFLFRNENALCEAIAADPFLWWRMGCLFPVEYRTHITPDFIARIRGGKRKAPEQFKVEAEMVPTNFNIHGHKRDSAHLIISLKTTSARRMLKGIDVISLYRKMNDGWYHWSLDDDLDMLFRGKQSVLFPPEGDSPAEEPSESGQEDPSLSEID